MNKLKKIALLFLLTIFCLTPVILSPPIADATLFNARTLTGGSSTSLDGINGRKLKDGDRAWVLTTSTIYFYYLDADSAASESSPDIISPDSNAGDKRWILAAHTEACDGVFNFYLSDFTTLAVAASTLNALNADCTLVIDTDYTMVASVSFDAEVTLQFAPGNVITSTAYALMVGGGPDKIIAGDTQQIFAGTGAVTFSLPGDVSPWWWYSGSGSWHTAINYADASLPATNGTVAFPDGEYACTAQVTPTSYHTWKAVNKWRAKLVQQTTNTNLIYVNDKDSVVIDGLYLEGDDTFSTNGRGIYIYESCNHVTVENCYITKMGRNGVVVQQSASGNEPSDIIIRNNTIIENQGNGIFYNSVNGGEISSNYIKSNGQSVGTANNIGFGIVLDCYFLIDGCYNIVVANNEILGNKEGGIQGLGLQSCTITNNTVDDSGDALWDSPTAWDLCGINLRYKTGAATLYPQNNIVTNNTIRRSYFHGIYLSAALHTTVTGNNILDSGYGYTATTSASGVFCEHVGGQMANGNNISVNNIRKTSASAYAEYGIYGDGLQACKVDTNQIYQGGDTAQISLNGDGTYNTIGTSCCNNTIYGVATEAATVVLTYFTDGKVDGNNIYNAGVLGISSDANSINNIIPQLTNKVQSASTADFSIAAPTTNNHVQERLLSITTVAFNADADTTLYTVPTGYRCVLAKAIVVAGADAGATTTISIGANGTETDFIPANTLSNLDAQYDSVILMPIPNTTPLKNKSYAAATVIQAQVASQSGGATNTVYLYGILY